MCGNWCDINRPKPYLPNYTNEENAARSGFCCPLCENSYFNPQPGFSRLSGSERDVWLKDGSIERVWECSAPKFKWEFSMSAEDRKRQIEEYKRDPEAFLKKQEQKRIAEDADPRVQERRLKQEFIDRAESIHNSINYYENEIVKNKSEIRYENENKYRNYESKIYVYEEAIKRHRNSLLEAKERLKKCKFEEYWAFHQAEKKRLEEEKQSLEEQIAILNKEILEIPKKTEGYANMVEFKKKTQKLTAEKKAFGFFKFKDKKALQTQIDSLNNEINIIQSCINSAIDAVQKRITSLENRINAINTELAKPR